MTAEDERIQKWADGYVARAAQKIKDNRAKYARLCKNCSKADKSDDMIYLNSPFGKTYSEWFCSDECRHEAVLEAKSRKFEEWMDIWIPPQYQQTEIEKLPCGKQTENLLTFDDVGEHLGFYAFGPTGTGKTRSMFLWLIEQGNNEAIYYRAKQLASEIVERTQPYGKGGFDSWFEGLLSAEILAIDEVDKLPISQRVMTEFLELMEDRASKLKTTVFAAQRSAANLFELVNTDEKKKSMAETAAAIIRRIMQNTKPIKFSNVLPMSGTKQDQSTAIVFQ